MAFHGGLMGYFPSKASADRYAKEKNEVHTTVEFKVKPTPKTNPKYKLGKYYVVACKKR